MVGQFKVCLLTNYPFQPLVESLNLENPTIPHFNTDRVIHTEINLRYFFFNLILVFRVNLAFCSPCPFRKKKFKQIEQKLAGNKVIPFGGLRE